MPVIAIHPTIDPALLPGAQFADAFSTVTCDPTLDARSAAIRMFARPPRWMNILMTLRDMLVTPLGLKTERHARTITNRVGIFLVLSETPQRLVVGLDDRHQDFRAVIDIAPQGKQQRVTLTTVVKTHNAIGRVYLATIMPFHQLIVRAMLRQLG